ncbi:MAG: hypothetical protein WKF30_08745 [Pyrinomonadaceae bacterium]
MPAWRTRHGAARRVFRWHSLYYFPGTVVARLKAEDVRHQATSRPSSRARNDHAALLWSHHSEPNADSQSRVNEAFTRPSNNRRLILASEHFRIDYTADLRRRDAERILETLEASRDRLRRRLRSANLGHINLPDANLIIHATTASFVAATGQPGWVAAVTRGRTINMQPVGVLVRRGILATTLRHEYAHAVIEAVGRGTTPRWLAEGLAAHVAGEGPMLNRIAGAENLSGDEIEKRLQQSVSQQQMRELYAAAYRAVRDLVRAKGEASIWQRIAENQKVH